MKKETLMSDKEVALTLERLAQEVKRREMPGEAFSLVGIHTRGIPLARRMAQLLHRDPEQIGTLDINLYRDDLSTAAEMPILKETHVPFDVHGRSILLIDDVLYTGRTIRSALDAMIDLGRPKRMMLLVFVDRGGRELPIQADFCGKRVEVGPKDNVKVRLQEVDGYDALEVLKA
jgi:pyrimidine operon attenuation protein / uracil phosphoribosyltransferase